MSKSLHIENESRRQINEDLGGSRFINILIYNYTSLVPLNEILDQFQINILSPDWDLDSNSTIEARDPNELFECFKILSDFIKSNYNELPLSHWVQSTPNSWQGASEYFKYKNRDCYLFGLHNLIEWREYVQIVWFEGENNNVKYFDWIKVDPIIKLGDSQTIIKTMNWAEEFSPILNILMNFCQKAIQNNEKIIWTIDN
ncbi:MAG: hypothetical protein ACI8ZM_001224 [Crocinitomix sp.]|jgi:hypothetical protein